PTKLPFISFFTNPALPPLKKYPQLNPQIHPHHIITKQYYHIRIPLSTHHPLLLPFLTHSHNKNFPQLQKSIPHLPL
ncbi:2-oxo acid dehydrogenase subunit E2, partial [Staphylococcus hominis]|uniref:2-oxo acid dehydrogenase subunit E2 n=1 Tax=Staphylococcus hominis TaxID=1290 RepID=UPI001643F332